MITFKCFSCGATLRVSDEKAGKRGKCPRCTLMVRVPQSQAEANAAEAHRAARRARMINPPKTEEEDDLFDNVVSEVLGSTRMRAPSTPSVAPSQTSPAPKVLGAAPIDARRDVVTQAMAVARAESAPTAEVVEPDQADKAPALDETQPAAGHDAPDAEMMRQSAEVPSAPPMSWPVEKTQADAKGASDLDALVRAAQDSPTRIAAADPAGARDEGGVAAVLNGAGPAGERKPRRDRPARPPGTVAPVGAGTTSIRGSHGLGAMSVLFVVALGVLALVGWRNWEHTWNFSAVITRCLPEASFDDPDAPNQARTGSMTGKVLLCNDMGGPCPVPLSLSDDVIARSADQVGTVIFIRRNDEVRQTRAFRKGERILARAPAGYEMCAVDVTSGKRICTVSVGAENTARAVEKLYWLIKRCVRPERRK